MNSITDVYTSNADFTKLYHFSKDGSLDYAALYRGIEGAEMVAAELAAITVQCIDPVEDGWELVGFESLEEAQEQCDCESPADLIASSAWYEGSYASMLRYDIAEECSQPTVGAFTACLLGTDAE